MRASTVRNTARGPLVAARALPLYIALVVTAGTAVLAASAPAVYRTAYPFTWLLFTVLAVLTGTFTMKVASVAASVSVTDTFFIAIAMLFGPGAASLTVAITSGLESWRRKHAWHRFAFNVAAPTLSLWAGAHAFFLIARVPPLAEGTQPIAGLVVPLLCMSAVHFSLNSGLTAIAIGLDTRTSPLRIWRQHFLWLSLSYLAAGSVAFCVILLIQQVNFGAIAMVLPLVIVFHLTLRASFGRLEDARRHLGDMDKLYLSTVETLAMAIDAKDDVTSSHVRRVQTYAVALARALGEHDELTIKAIEAAALLHDTGKLAVPEHILNKPGKLTPAEFETMKLHVDVGADILSLVDFPYPVVPIVRCHHENWDGSGYPRGVRGEDIPIGARILSVVDCFDALTSDRPYRAAMTEEAAFEILRLRKGTMYDPTVVERFITVYRDITVSDVEVAEQKHVLQQIRQARPAQILKPPVLAPAVSPPPASDEVLAFVSLARLASGEFATADVLALASTLMRDIVPGVTIVWYILDAASQRLIAMDAAGPAEPFVRGTSLAVGERLTGWVAAHRQLIVNSDPALDLGARAAEFTPKLESCMSTPLVAGDALVGVLTLYAPGQGAFGDGHGRLIDMIAPHVAQTLTRARRSVDAQADKAVSIRDFRLVSTRG